MYGYPVTFCIKTHQFFKIVIIIRFFKDYSLLDTSVDDMVIPVYLYTWSSCHTIEPPLF